MAVPSGLSRADLGGVDGVGGNAFFVDECEDLNEDGVSVFWNVGGEKGYTLSRRSLAR